jgi:hypothetical protein
MKLVAIWMAMAPIPVIALLAAAVVLELAIVSVPFAKVYAIRTVFTVIPLMVVTMITIVIASRTDADHHLRGSGCLGRRYGGESRSEKKKT